MLHSTLPRAFLPPGLNYLGGYYGEDAHPYTAAAGYVPCIEDPYARIPDQRVHLGGWEASARPMSPSPLDLSLKPPHSLPTRSVELEAVEVDRNDDRRCRGTTQRIGIPVKRSYSHCEELGSSIEEVESEIRRSPSVHSYHSYDDVQPHQESVDHRPFTQHTPLLQNNIIRSSLSLQRYHSYEDVPSKKETLGPPEISHNSRLSPDPSVVSCLAESESYHPLSAQKELVFTSPNHSRSHGYHQHLLLTPQHHLQGVHAPMTPPSTPSPPQCGRRRAREDQDVTPPHSSTTLSSATPKQSAIALSEKPSPRPKKKHARRLKFDEDNSSPVSGTVILGPDEAVVTGDIDPAFNIVEVTEEARAELAKIENRLGPYQCKLCRHLHDDAFQLAQHRCSRIAHVEYRCPECDKRFSCPANLASHRRWHKPRIPNGENLNGSRTTANLNTPTTSSTRDAELACARCDAKFTRSAALRKHLANQHPETNNNVPMANNNVNDNNSEFNELNSTLPGKTLCLPGTMQLVNASLTNEIP